MEASNRWSTGRGRLFASCKLRYLNYALSLVLMFGSVAFGQGVRGTIIGQVTDQTGAVIPGATATLVNVDTQQEVRTVKTDSSGVYQFLELEPAVYTVVLKAQGFSEARLQAIKLEPARHLTFDVTLQPAGTTEAVTVTASEELLDRESGTLGTTVEHRRVEGLPLNGRNVLDLALLQPGVVAPPAGGFGAGAGFRVNGSRAVENNITLDGSNFNEVATGGIIGVQPRPDAVEEFRLLTSNYDAEFGRNTGAVVNIVQKSGTNSYHGDGRIFYRPTFLSAGRFLDNLAGLPVRTFERKEFGGNLGGPINIPHVYKGSERTFFFVDYEGRRQRTADSNTISGLPTLAERSGIFSHTIVDPATGHPFANNTIQPSRFSPIAQYYMNFMPIPDASGRATVQGQHPLNTDYLTAKFDHQINKNQTLSFSFDYSQQSEIAPFAFGGSTLPGFPEVDAFHTYNYILRHTDTISPTLINSLLLSYARFNFPSVAPLNQTTPAQIGFTANFVANPAFAGPPRITFADRGFNVGNTIQGPQARISQNYQIQDSLSWVKGAHRFKFGFDGTHYVEPQLFLFVNQGILTYSGLNGGNTTGDDFADFLIGEGPIAAQFGANGARDYRQNAAALFAQDTWKLSDTLTLSLGLRWEYNGPLTDKFNRVAYYRPGEVSQLLTSGQLRSFEGVPITVPAGGKAPNGLVFVGDPDNVLGGTVPNGGINPRYDNLAPRVALAYSPRHSGGFLHTLFGDSQTVIRAGWGIYFGAAIGDTALQQLSAPGFNGTNSFFFPASGTLADPFAPDPFHHLAQIPNPFAASAFNITAPLSQFSRPIDPHIATPYSDAYNLTVERSFLRNYVASVSYVGSRGRHLFAQEQVNPSIGTFIPANRAIPTPTVNNGNSRRLNDDIHLGLPELVSAGNSWYNALEAQVQRRFANGLLFQLAYTRSKLITDSDTSRGNLDLLNRAAGRGLSAQDVPNRLVASWIYDLPWARTLHGIEGKLLDGFSFGGIATFQSGTPFSVLNPTDIDGTGGAIVNFADLGAAFTQTDPRKNNTRAFNPDAVVPVVLTSFATQFRRGTEGFNQFRLANGINNWDLILSKKTRLWNESSQLELRFEAFNAFNHAQFTTVDTNLTHIVKTNGVIDPNKSSFGKFTATREARIIQLGARIRF
ncbi:MAG TPA: carboxypeptidase regulatory-like domain-containing protein [Blastocatellia bacterium]|nr:carboxypeptidase regulatory-like domain-containing protein [Blastocatellia bacterium]